MRNPLRDPSQPFGLPDFPAIEPEHVLPALEELLGTYRRGIEDWLNFNGPSDWSLIEAEVEWSDDLSRAWSPVSHLNSVADNEELRAAYNRGLDMLTEHDNWRQQHAGIFNAYRRLRASGDFSGLSNVQRRIVELELRDFELSGVGLPADKQEQYRDVVLRLTRLGSRFAENLIDATRAWTLHFDDSSRLSGLPAAELNLLAGVAASHGRDGWMIDLSFPSFNAIMTHADDRELRARVYEAYVTRASDQGPQAGQWDNAPLIAELLSLRHRLANLLGFENYVEYALSRRMAASPESVMSFLRDLADKALPEAKRQFAVLNTFAAENGAELPLQAWDAAYWSERLRKSELHLSDEELKPFFPLEAMTGALFQTAKILFEITLERDESIAAWHQDVQFYWLRNEADERFAGIYMDLFARRDKRGGAWMDVCQSRRKLENGIQLPLAFLTCNFAPPVRDMPSLLTHDDVQTLFHEFGHCLHHLLTGIDWPQVNGINNVEWDAVELPSQLLENWCWQEEILSRFARHYETGESMPEDLKQRLLRSRRFQKAIFLVRQLEYAICDLRLHLEYDPERPVDPLGLLEEVRSELAVIPVPQWSRFLNGFSHIFSGGYAAGYYSYLWAELLAADAWGRFREAGVFDRCAGQALRDEILAMGAARPALQSFVAFRGRPPLPGPLLERYGLAPDVVADVKSA